MTLNESKRVSDITLPDPAWRYLLLFQSWVQFFSWLAGVSSVVALGTIIIWCLGDSRLIPQCAAAAFLGGAWSLLFASKAQFSVRGAVPSETTALESMLKEWRYIERQDAGQARRFRQNLPRWLRWSESEVTIAREGDALVCTGPQLLIRAMRKTLLSAG